MKCTMVVTMVAAQMFAAAAVSAQATPSGKDILLKSLHATGADTIMAKHTSLKVTGMLSVPAQGVSYPIEIDRSSIGAFHLVVNIEGMGTVEQGYTNGTAWTDGLQGTAILEGTAAAAAKRQAMWTDSPDNYASITNEGIEKFQGKDAYKVTFVTKDSAKVTRYFDPTTGLNAGTVSVTDVGGAPTTVTTIVSDYKDFNGLKFPMKQVQMAGENESNITLEKLEFDTVPATAFVLPAAVAALKK